MTVKKFISSILLTCTLTTIFTSCTNSTTDNSINNDTKPYISGISASDEGNEESVGYQASMNFVAEKSSENGLPSYIPIFDDIVYDGGEFDIYVQLGFVGSGHDLEKTDALAMFCVDGYLQEFSLGNDEKALVHKISVPNGGTITFSCKCRPVTYDTESKEHTICAVVLPYWEMGSEKFIRTTAVASVTREIILRTINKPEKDNVVQMKVREQTEWDKSGNAELPFAQNDSDHELAFYCYGQEKMYCYLFCGEELVSQNGKYIFVSDNKDPDKIAVCNISTDEFDKNNPCFVIYISKDKGADLNSCIYFWKEDNQRVSADTQ